MILNDIFSGKAPLVEGPVKSGTDMTMRSLMNLVEAKKSAAPATTYGSPEYFRRYANPQAAQALAKFRQQAAGDIRFNMTLVQKAAATAKAQHARYLQDMQEEDQARIDPHYAFSVFMEALQHVNENRHIPDRDARWNDFQDRKPDVEQSDELTFYRTENEAMKNFEFWCDPTDPHFANYFVPSMAEFGDLLASSNGSYTHGLDDGFNTALAAHLPIVLVFLALCNGADASKWLA